MNSRIIDWPRWLFLTAVLSLPACGGSESVSSTPPPRDLANALKELGEVYKYRAAEKMPPPAKVEDLADHEDAFGTAWPAIQDGQIVILWRVGYDPNSTAILAYEKTVPTSGGNVLLRNGTVKTMTADEFKSAPKAR